MPSPIERLIPDVDIMLSLAPEELGYVILNWIHQKGINGKFLLEELTREVFTPGADRRTEYQNRSEEVEKALSEAWQWLLINILIIPERGQPAGWMTLSRRGKSITSQAQFDSYRMAAAFPKSLLHPNIAERVWLDLARGQLETAVFNSFKAVEEAVRDAGGYGPTDIGIALMRKAFDKTNGPLSDLNQPEPEREALAHLFSGAIGSYKNPHSHRTVSITDHQEAQEMVLLASHLLRIVDTRRNNRTP